MRNATSNCNGTCNVLLRCWQSACAATDIGGGSPRYSNIVLSSGLVSSTLWCDFFLCPPVLSGVTALKACTEGDSSKCLPQAAAGSPSREGERAVFAREPEKGASGLRGPHTGSGKPKNHIFGASGEARLSTRRRVGLRPLVISVSTGGRALQKQMRTLAKCAVFHVSSQAWVAVGERAKLQAVGSRPALPQAGWCAKGDRSALLCCSAVLGVLATRPRLTNSVLNRSSMSHRGLKCATNLSMKTSMAQMASVGRVVSCDRAANR